jgi:outer membrane protein assembly factor BamA
MAWDLTAAAHRNQISHAAYLKAGQTSIERRFPWESTAPGLHFDPQNLQGELCLTLDRRDERGQPRAGWRLEGFYGYAMGTGSDEVDFTRYGGEGQAYLPLGPAHTLALRVAGEEARTSQIDPSTGKIRPIKLTELPSLGGRSTLRGYLPDRFIDNASALGTVEYRYRLSPLIEGCLFADAGKVMPRLLDVDLSDLHRSWGAGLNFARPDQFYFRLYGALSDEDWIFNATLEPVLDRQDRRERR